MVNNKYTEYGILYKKYALDNRTYLLIPINIMEGYQIGDEFYSVDLFPVLSLKSIDKNDELIGSVVSVESLIQHYQFDEDIELLCEYYFIEEKDNILLVKKQEDNLETKKVNIQKLASISQKEIYEIVKGNSVISLNNEAINNLKNMNDINKIKERLSDYQEKIKLSKMRNEHDGITRVVVDNGRISEIDFDGSKVKPLVNTKINTSILNEGSNELNGDISLIGLENYLKERIIGHDQEIETIATILISNYLAKYEDGTESILLLGPTGTGKTATFEVASKYLNIPCKIINSANLNPAGYHGNSLDSILNGWRLANNGDLAKIQRSIIVFDEFDKIESTNLELKVALKEILLKFMEGSAFEISSQFDNYTFDTRMLSKAYLGAFSELFIDKQIGFNALTNPKKEIKLKEITKKYFSEEQLSRISHVLIFDELSRENKKRVLLESKLSALLMKIKRLERDYNLDIYGIEEFVDALIENLDSTDGSMRDVNNRIYESFLKIQRELLINPNKYKNLRLTKELVLDKKKFDLS